MKLNIKRKIGKNRKEGSFFSIFLRENLRFSGTVLKIAEVRQKGPSPKISELRQRGQTLKNKKRKAWQESVGATMLKKIIIGILAGMICGLFGTGGGMILVPAFVYMLKIAPKKARATSLCCMLVMVITSSIFYYKNNYIDWRVGFLCAIGGVVGGYLGAKLLKRVPDYILKIIFICFLTYASYSIIF